MNADVARRRIVALSLGTTLVIGVVLILSPLVLQLSSSDAFRLLQIVIPVFAGYLGSAVLFLFQPGSSEQNIADSEMLKTLVYWSFGIFWALACATFAYFFISNIPGGVPGMHIDELSNLLTLIVALMNVTVGGMVTFLFRADPNQFHRLFKDSRKLEGSDKP